MLSGLQSKWNLSKIYILCHLLYLLKEYTVSQKIVTPKFPSSEKVSHGKY